MAQEIQDLVVRFLQWTGTLICHDTLPPWWLTFLATNWGRYKIAAILQTKFSKFPSLYRNNCIFMEISLKFVPGDSVNKMPSLVQIIPQPQSQYLTQWWPRSLKGICIIRPQWLYCIVSTWHKSHRSDIRHHWFRQRVVTSLIANHHYNQHWQIPILHPRSNISWRRCVQFNMFLKVTWMCHLWSL